MSSDLKKYVAIRYNTATGFMPSQWKGKGRANLDPVWLVERLALFDTYCAPSLEGQSLTDFTVLVAFDSETHENYIRTVCDCAIGIDVRPVLVGAGQNHNVAFNAFVQSDTDAEFVSLTRLDSDDALAPTFMERVDFYARREIAKGEVDQQPLYIAFPHGQNFDAATNRYTHHEYPTSAFGTLVEKRSPTMNGVYCDEHTRMAMRFNTVGAAAKEVQWCIVIHDNNAANVLRGKPVAEPAFTVGRPGAETETRAPARKAPAQKQMPQTSAKVSRNAGNLIRFLLGRPMVLRK
ncbi:hypothetical protein ASD99_25455 [Mesorhizobium sp. Root695]|jgi:hypothetical protein|nr:hypothetical protein ASD99_25455 [Mesorhizobium sp. Root695]